MTKNDSKMGKLLKGAGKLVNIAGQAVEGTVDVVDHQIDEYNKRHANDFRVPDLLGLTEEQAEGILETLDTKYVFLDADPRASYISMKAGTIIKTSPSANKTVAPGSLIKIFILSAETLEASQQLSDEAKQRHEKRRESAKAVVSKVTDTTVSGIRKAKDGLTDIIAKTKKSKKQNTDEQRERKIIDATEIDISNEKDRDE